MSQMPPPPGGMPPQSAPPGGAPPPAWGSPQPPPRKSSPWKWIACGCIVVVLVIAIGIAVMVAFVLKLAKNSGPVLLAADLATNHPQVVEVLGPGDVNSSEFPSVNVSIQNGVKSGETTMHFQGSQGSGSIHLTATAGSDGQWHVDQADFTPDGGDTIQLDLEEYTPKIVAPVFDTSQDEDR